MSLTIEKIAAEIAREILRDDAFKDELKAIARRSTTRAFTDLHRHGGRTPKRRAKR